MPQRAIKGCLMEMPNSQTAPPRRRARRFWLKLGGSIFVVLALVALAFCWYIGALGENFRAVDAERCFRSGQVTPESIQRHVKDQKIKSVINLRGHSHSAWYTKELEACQTAGVEHFDVKLDPNYLPPPENLKELIARFEQGPYPMLMHCRAGADRSGLAATLYAMIVGNKSLDDAVAQQMTWKVGHIKYDSGDRFLEIYRQNSNGMKIKEWILQKYPDVYEKEGGGKKLFDHSE